MANIDLQNRSPKVERLPDYRQRVTRIYDVLNNIPKSPSEILAEAWLLWGTADIDYDDCLLIHQDMQGQEGVFEEPCKDPPILIRVYEQIDPSLETPVGNADVSIDQAGNTTVSQSYLQFSTGTAVYGVPGVTVAPAPHTDCILKTDDRTDDGTLRRIKRTFINRGILSQADETKNNGSLLIRTLTYINEVPPTPSGYTVFSRKVDYPAGLPVYTYSFAKGNGQISSLTEYRMSPDQGTTGITTTTIKYLSDPSVNVNPITPPGAPSTELISVDFDEADGYRIWTAIYASGTGVVESSTDYRNNGQLRVYSITSINSAPSAPSPTIGGTVTLIKQSQRNGTRVEDGTVIYDYQWAEGYGTIEDNIIIRSDGLREETVIALGVRIAPSGIVSRDDYELIEGVIKYTVTCIQSSTGGDPTTETVSFQRFEQFIYPGRLKTYVATAGSGQRFLDIFKSPPCPAQVQATVTVTYQTSNAMPSLPATLWQPLDGATIIGQWVGQGNFASNLVESWRDYRSVDNTGITITGSIFAPNDSIFGQLIYGGTDATAQATGGPDDPGGLTWVIGTPMLELAFQDSSGTKYYRVTIVTADIPDQPALPV